MGGLYPRCLLSDGALSVVSLLCGSQKPPQRDGQSSEIERPEEKGETAEQKGIIMSEMGVRRGCQTHLWRVPHLGHEECFASDCPGERAVIFAVGWAEGPEGSSG